MIKRNKRKLVITWTPEEWKEQKQIEAIRRKKTLSQLLRDEAERSREHLESFENRKKEKRKIGFNFKI